MNSKTAKVNDVRTDGGVLTVWLNDGRVLSVPLKWYPSLAEASETERKEWRPSGAGRGIHWPGLDYDLSIDGIRAGRKEHPGALGYVRKARVNERRRRLGPRSLAK